jgi:pantothenate kinase
MSDELLDDAARLLALPRARAFLALVGPPAAGKSTLAVSLVAGLNRRFGQASAGYVPLDGLHLSNAQLERLGIADCKGAPATFDVNGYLALLRRLRSELSSPVYIPGYDRTVHEPIAARHVVEPGTRLVVTEGNYLASQAEGWREVADLVDELWYVETDDALREQRLYQRQLAGGRDPQLARDWVTRNDRPNGELVKADRRHCTRVVSPAPH